jgi:hypothetical protein
LSVVFCLLLAMPMAMAVEAEPYRSTSHHENGGLEAADSEVAAAGLERGKLLGQVGALPAPYRVEAEPYRAAFGNQVGSYA